MGEVGRSRNSVCIAATRLLQSCPTLCDPIDSSPTGSTIPGILQARTLEWVSISFSNAWQWKVKVKSLSRVRLLATPWTAAYQAPPSMGFFRQEYWSGLPLPSLSVCITYPLFWFLASSVRCWNYSSLTSFLCFQPRCKVMSIHDRLFWKTCQKATQLKNIFTCVEDLWYFLFPSWHILILSSVMQTQKSWNVFSLASCFYNLVKVLDFVPTYYRFCETCLLSFLMHISVWLPEHVWMGMSGIPIIFPIISLLQITAFYLSFKAKLNIISFMKFSLTLPTRINLYSPELL